MEESCSQLLNEAEDYYFQRVQGTVEPRLGSETSLECEGEASKAYWSEILGSPEDECRVAVEETYGRLKEKWSYFFLDHMDNLELGEKIAEGAQAKIFGLRWLDVGEKIAEGGQSKIFEVLWPGLKGGMFDYNRVLLKVFRKDTSRYALSSLCSKEFFGYANHANEVGMPWNPRICRIFGGLLLKNGRFAFMMERYWGDLRKVIDLRMTHFGNRKAPFTAMIAKRIMLEIAEGMQGLHELNVVHRDLKASNIFIKPIGVVDGDPEVFKVSIGTLDGVHRGWDPVENDAFSCVVGDYECNKGVVGTWFWRAPEVLLAVKNRHIQPAVFTEKADIYGYSMTCYEILTGKMPFESIRGNDYDAVLLRGARPLLPSPTDPALHSLLERCWDHDPSKRPTFEEICEELRVMMLANSEQISSKPQIENEGTSIPIALDKPRSSDKGKPEPNDLESSPDNEGNSKPIGLEPEPDELEPQADTAGNPEPTTSSQGNCLIQWLGGFKTCHNLVVELFMFAEPVSVILASSVDLGHHFFVSHVQCILSFFGSFGPHRRQALVCTRRVRSRDLKSVQFLGQGFSGFIYETTWLNWYGKEKLGRFARKDFPGADSKIFEVEVARLVILDDHPNVVKVFGWTVDRLGCSLVLEFVNTDIESVVEKRKEAPRKVSAFNSLIDYTASPFELVDEVYIMMHIARAMEYLHSNGVGHGGLRPNNILVDLEADPMIVKVVDFGLCESKKRSSLVSRRAQFVRTLEWKAPETWKSLPDSLIDSPDEYLWEKMDSVQVDESVLSDARELADVYSFAITCAYIMGGTVAYSKSSLSQLRQRVLYEDLRPKIPSRCPEVLRKLIESSWDSDPVKRPRFSHLKAKLDEYFMVVKQGKVNAQSKLDDYFTAVKQGKENAQSKQSVEGAKRRKSKHSATKIASHLMSKALKQHQTTMTECFTTLIEFRSYHTALIDFPKS